MARIRRKKHEPRCVVQKFIFTTELGARVKLLKRVFRDYRKKICRIVIVIERKLWLTKNFTRVLYALVEKDNDVRKTAL